VRVLKKMYVSQQDSFVFYWPVVHPEDLATCHVYGIHLLAASGHTRAVVWRDRLLGELRRLLT
jgi:hypothetical protein